MSFLEELKNRRSIYALGRNTEVSDEKIVEIIKEAVRQSPSAFNSQTSRVVILLNDEVTKFWDELVANDLVETMKVQGAPETAIASVNTWTALSAELGLGGNLQHYNPVIDASVQAVYGVPASWKLRGQLNFGSIEAETGEKEFMNDDDRFKVIG
ncbi:TPA: nitroreductase family protein [Streptococcus agalactiae]